jgi:hypothetical protein
MFDADLEAGGSVKRFYKGTVKQVRASEPQFVQHYVVFDDGDRLWLDLARLEVNGYVQWTD